LGLQSGTIDLDPTGTPCPRALAKENQDPFRI